MNYILPKNSSQKPQSGCKFPLHFLPGVRAKSKILGPNLHGFIKYSVLYDIEQSEDNVYCMFLYKNWPHSRIFSFLDCQRGDFHKLWWFFISCTRNATSKYYSLLNVVERSHYHINFAYYSLTLSTQHFMLYAL